MTIFTIISEGGTDQEVLTNILTGYFDASLSGSIRFNFEQPLRDSTDVNSLGAGGWTEVLKYCADDKLAESLKTAEALDISHYHVIHLDSDISLQPAFNVPVKEDVEEYINDIKSRLIQQITLPLYQQYQHKIFFAISVDSIECWIIPLFDITKSNINIDCEDSLRAVLADRNQQLSKNNRFYSRITDAYTVRMKVVECFSANRSLEIFLSSLEDKFKQLQPTP